MDAQSFIHSARTWVRSGSVVGVVLACVVSGCNPTALGVKVPIDEDLYSAAITYCGVNAEPLWNPDKTLVLVEPGRAFVATYDVTNLDDEERVYTVRIYRTIDDGPEELFWTVPEMIKPGETVSGRGSEGLNEEWGPDTKFECRVQLWNL